MARMTEERRNTFLSTNLLHNRVRISRVAQGGGREVRQYRRTHTHFFHEVILTGMELENSSFGS